ncbi:MAG: ThuA domain-containing protein [Clostridia bacterium]|nr:ThuA domain-containing protein [Clostridia bacterium]
MGKIRAVIFTSPMGHDVVRVKNQVKDWLEETEQFEVLEAGWYHGAPMSVDEFMAKDELVNQTDLFFLNCPDDPFTTEKSRIALEQAVGNGAGFLGFHGIQPSCRNWPEIEKMVGLLWRETATHGDYDWFDVTPETPDHPIMRGIKPFRTKEEVYCGLTNVHHVPLQVLASAHSPKERLSRHGHPGTGNEEPILTLGSYGKGITVNFLLGHVWPFYTGHGLLENTMLSFKPAEVRQMLVRSCLWAAGSRLN